MNDTSHKLVQSPCAAGWRYQLALLLATVPVLLYILWQALLLRQLHYLKQRLGFGFPHQLSKPIWLHAASVGEAVAAAPLIKALRSAHPRCSIIVTTMTPTGANIVKQGSANTDKAVIHCYLPFDWRGAVQRFISTIRPCCALIMETELWPNLYHACASSNIPVVIVNGRISRRSLNTSVWIKRIYKNALHNVSAVLARSEVDADGYLALGAHPERIKQIGNIKYGAAKPLTDIRPVELPRAFVLAASTHDNEELEIARQWLQLANANKTGKRLLVIAPRHPNRSTDILKQVAALNTSIAVRSKGETITDDTQIYLADTLGELTGLMANAELVIMGGSFTPVGGHNVLEPAMLGKAIIFGPHMENFADEAAGLLKQRAAILAEDYAGLLQLIPDLLSDDAKRITYGDRAQLFMQGNQDIVPRYLKEIESICSFAEN